LISSSRTCPHVSFVIRFDLFFLYPKHPQNRHFNFHAPPATATDQNHALAAHHTDSADPDQGRAGSKTA